MLRDIHMSCCSSGKQQQQQQQRQPEGSTIYRPCKAFTATAAATAAAAAAAAALPHLCIAVFLDVWIAQLQLHRWHLASIVGVLHPERHAVSASKWLEALLGAALPAWCSNK
jgi:hypothetical protein